MHTFLSRGVAAPFLNSPELRRRFTLGTFFFDLPSAAERKAIWDIYLKKWNLNGELPDDEGWTGAEIKECCRKAWRLKLSLPESAEYIVPVSRSAADQFEALRRQASGRFLSASHPGVFTAESRQMAVSAGKRRRRGETCLRVWRQNHRHHRSGKPRGQIPASAGRSAPAQSRPQGLL